MKFSVTLMLLCFGITNIVSEDTDDPCMEIFNPAHVGAMCCDGVQSIKMFYDDADECKKNETSEDLKCPYYECLLNKRGLLEDGRIIDDKAMELLDVIVKKYPKEKNIADRVKMACLEGQYEEYPSEDNCMALKYHVCVYTNVMLECDSWKKTKICNNLSDLVKKCKGAK